MDEIISYGRFQCSELELHKNRGMEITYIEKGLLEWMVEGVPEKVAAGSVFFTLPWQVHGSVNPREPDNTISHVLFHLDEDYIEPMDTFCFPDSLGFTVDEMRLLSSVFAQSTRHCFSATSTMKTLMPMLIQELQGTRALRRANIISLLRTILVELKRIVAGEVVRPGLHSPSEQRAQRLIADLPSNCDRKWTLTDMAHHCKVQRTQLNKIFQKLTGSTPMEYLMRIRMERAKTLLRETSLKIIDIAFECGFGSSQYFANSFKQATGATPSAYRKIASGLSTSDAAYWKNVPFRSEEEEYKRIRRFSDA